MVSFRRPRLSLRPELAALAIVTAFTLIRVVVILRHQGYWGVDGGAYLLSLFKLTGQDTTGIDFLRPPLAPGWLLWPLVRMFGTDMGLKWFHLAASLAPVPTFWLLARLFLRPWPAVLALTLFLADWMLAEMFTAGALPMFGMASMFLAIWAMIRLTARWSWVSAIGLAMSIPAIVYTNQTSAGIAAPVLAATTVGTIALAWRARRGSPVRSVIHAESARQGTAPKARTLAGCCGRILGPLAVGAMLAATAWPWYSGVTPGSSMLTYPGPTIAFYTVENSAWIQFASGLGVTVLLGLYGKGAIRVLAAPLAILTALQPFVSFDETIMNVFYRSRYVIQPFVYLGGVWLAVTYLWDRQPAWRSMLATFTAGAVVWAIMGYGVTLQSETKLERMVSPDSAAAIAWINQQPGTGGVLTNSYSYSLYVAALTNRQSPWTQIYSPPPYYVQQHTNATCVLNWVPGCVVEQAIRELGVDYVLVERLWPLQHPVDIAETVPDLGPAYKGLVKLSKLTSESVGLIWGAPPDPWAVTARAKWLEPVWGRGSVTVWRIVPAHP